LIFLDYENIDKIGKRAEDINFEVRSRFDETNKLIEDLPKTLILLGLYLYSLRYDQERGSFYLKRFTFIH
jgi:formate-dependent nitrite reductase cytochrome c552 subunit